MPTTDITIINKLGLHARAAAKLVGVAAQFSAKVNVGRTQDKLVDAKSIMSVMLLAAAKGSTIHIHTEGDDADQALQAVIALINNRFDEPE
ncbi:HPr family phosphocarrier protein [Atopomonas sediminilitoris]|uniref:HPr family phosphocarrier protein n=1 Tax=Atopomonas sediminilitoris TaxID=2919919 RepID=UPI001F4DB112|nr:HPr family phosphocarrier protein [Atopomonas sediminilitoris]MCJ8169970.1 HPr family phosphocarrier protein [Atopomonas sediminilitoris]